MVNNKSTFVRQYRRDGGNPAKKGCLFSTGIG